MLLAPVEDRADPRPLGSKLLTFITFGHESLQAVFGYSLFIGESESAQAHASEADPGSLQLGFENALSVLFFESPVRYVHGLAPGRRIDRLPACFIGAAIHDGVIRLFSTLVGVVLQK
jgi:hypothetical protein